MPDHVYARGHDLQGPGASRPPCCHRAAEAACGGVVQPIRQGKCYWAVARHTPALHDVTGQRHAHLCLVRRYH